jgi:hypothetical protein
MPLHLFIKILKGAQDSINSLYIPISAELEQLRNPYDNLAVKCYELRVEIRNFLHQIQLELQLYYDYRRAHGFTENTQKLTDFREKNAKQRSKYTEAEDVAIIVGFKKITIFKTGREWIKYSRIRNPKSERVFKILDTKFIIFFYERIYFIFLDSILLLQIEFEPLNNKQHKNLIFDRIQMNKRWLH